MLFRPVRFLILMLTLGRIRWLMRLTWLWRLIVFLGVTGWLSKKLRRFVGLDKKANPEVDSAWADALRYTPQTAPAGAGAGAGYPAAPPATASQTTPEFSYSRSEVSGTTADGSTETITIDEVSAGGIAESIVRIADDAGNSEVLVTDSAVEDIDLVNLGESASDTAEPVDEEIIVEELVIEEIGDDAILIDDISVEQIGDEIVIEEIVIIEPISDDADIETLADLETIALIDTLEAAEPNVPEVVAEPEKPKRKRVAKVKPESVEELAAPVVLIDPDWVRGDGTGECPDSHPVKAKASSMIYYTPESGHYERTVPDVCFAGEADAEAAGYRPPRR